MNTRIFVANIGISSLCVTVYTLYALFILLLYNDTHPHGFVVFAKE